MLVLAVLAAELIVGKALPGAQLIALSFITPIFISMGSFAINDYFDVRVDRANKRYDRPLVSGAMSKGSAALIAFASFAIGVAASAFINPQAFLIAFVFALFAALYSYRLKEILLVGNLYVAASMAIPFIFGDFVVSGAMSPTILLLSATVLSSGFAREIHGTIRDFGGDKKVRNVRSIPSYMGARNASYLAFAFYLIAIALSVWLFFFALPFYHNIFYIVPIAAVDILLVYVSVLYAANKARSKKTFSAARNLSLFAMGLAIVVYLLSCFVYLA
jgi:geranylgeranylglycerol-phosphate geranylgeranyltransferase